VPNGIEVIQAAPEEKPILANLLELYAHDFSEFHDVAIGEDGRFGYKSLPLYWSEPDRYPFLVRSGGRLAGLVFVKKGRKSLAIRLCGIWLSFLLFVDTGGVESELR